MQQKTFRQQISKDNDESKAKQWLTYNAMVLYDLLWFKHIHQETYIQPLIVNTYWYFLANLPAS